MNVLFHTWDPGLTSDVPNSAGGSLWIRYLWDRLRVEGHTVMWAGDGEPEGVITPRADESLGDFLSHADVLVLFWRWVMNIAYEDRNRAYAKQRLLLGMALDADIPILVHDQDHKITEDEIDELLANDVTLAAPEVTPRPGYVQLLYPNPYSSFRPPKKLDSKVIGNGPFLTYIGNNYERMEQFEKYIVKASEMGIPTVVWGNWLEPGPDRLSPEEVKALAPNIDFRGRLPQSRIIDELASAFMTVHLSKPSYCEPGFVTMRWCEAAVAGILSLVPGEFTMPTEYEPALIHDGEEIFWLSVALHEETYSELVMAQQDWVSRRMRVEPWLDMLKGMVR